MKNWKYIKLQFIKIVFKQFNNKEKKSAYEKLIKIFNELKDIESEKEPDKKLLKIIKILEKRNRKFKQTFPILYSCNKELYFNSLIYSFIKTIKNKYKNEKENIDEKKVIEEKNKYLNKRQVVLSSDDIDKLSTINNLNSILRNIYLVKTNKFINYMNNLSLFIKNIL